MTHELWTFLVEVRNEKVNFRKINKENIIDWNNSQQCHICIKYVPLCNTINQLSIHNYYLFMKK